jgi:hypothetical protein
MEVFANLAQSTLAADMTVGATSLVVAAPASFPATGNFRVRIDTELVLVTAVSGATFTITRGAEGTTAAGHLTGALVTAIVTKEALEQLQADATRDVCSGRLTLSTGLPVTKDDVLAATAVYYTPIWGNIITLYTNGFWRLRQYVEISVAVPATTNLPFDIFIYWTGSAVALETSVWANTTTRAVDLGLQDGVVIKSGDPTRRYMGSGCTTSVSGQIEDSTHNRLLFNWQNPVPRRLAFSVNAPHTSTNTTPHAFNSDSTNNVVMMVGGKLGLHVGINWMGGVWNYARLGPGLDGFTAYIDANLGTFYNGATIDAVLHGLVTATIPVGRHVIYLMETGAASPAANFSLGGLQVVYMG